MAYEKHIDFMRKHVTDSQTLIYGGYFLSNRGQVTIKNNLVPTKIHSLKIMISNQKKYWEKSELLSKFNLSSFPSRKYELIKSMKNLKMFSPNLTRKLFSKTFCPWITRVILGVMSTQKQLI